MRTLLCVIALAVGAGEALAQQGSEHQQHQPGAQATPDQHPPEGQGMAGMMSQGMHGEMAEAMRQHMMMQSPVPGVTIIINMPPGTDQGMPGMMPGHMGMMGQGMEGMGSESAPGTTALRQAAVEMHRQMDVELTGDPDGDFARAMIPHHQGAIEMAKIVLEHGKDPEIRELAQAVIDAQEEEIVMLREWLARNPQR